MAVGLVQFVGVFKTRLPYYIVFCFTMTTENYFENMTHFSIYLKGKTALADRRIDPFINHFFIAISVIKVQNSLFHVKQHIF